MNKLVLTSTKLVMIQYSTNNKLPIDPLILVKLSHEDFSSPGTLL